MRRKPANGPPDNKLVILYVGDGWREVIGQWLEIPEWSLSGFHRVDENGGCVGVYDVQGWAPMPQKMSMQVLLSEVKLPRAKYWESNEQQAQMERDLEERLLEREAT